MRDLEGPTSFRPFENTRYRDTLSELFYLLWERLWLGVGTVLHLCPGEVVSGAGPGAGGGGQGRVHEVQPDPAQEGVSVDNWTSKVDNPDKWTDNYLHTSELNLGSV